MTSTIRRPQVVIRSDAGFSERRVDPGVTSRSSSIKPVRRQQWNLSSTVHHPGAELVLLRLRHHQVSLCYSSLLRGLPFSIFFRTECLSIISVCKLFLCLLLFSLGLRE